jgi:hypothetical protein
MDTGERKMKTKVVTFKIWSTITNRWIERTIRGAVAISCYDLMLRDMGARYTVDA